MRILVVVASKHGSTWDIARAIGDTLAVCGVEVDVALVENMERVDDLNEYDGIVLGSAVYAGRWLKSARDFVEERAIEMSTLPVWIFSSGPLGYLPNSIDSQAVDIKHIAKLVRIKEHRIFAGKLKRRHLNPAEKFITRIMYAPQGDFRNWDEIHAWAAGIAQTLNRQRSAGRTLA